MQMLTRAGDRDEVGEGGEHIAETGHRNEALHEDSRRVRVRCGPRYGRNTTVCTDCVCVQQSLNNSILSVIQFYFILNLPHNREDKITHLPDDVGRVP